MNIKARIYARKVVLVYFYQRYFWQTIQDKELLLQEIDKLDKIVKLDEGQTMVDMRGVLSTDYFGDTDREIGYIVDQFFRKIDAEEIDFSYIQEIAPYFLQYEPEVHTKVDEHTVTFAYDQMDLMDRVIFVLGYIEYVRLKTPKEIILNEMIELAKRYGDDASAKLINGIGHKILSSVDALVMGETPSKAAVVPEITIPTTPTADETV